MNIKTKRKFSILLSFLLTLVMVVGMLPAMGQVAYAASAVSNLTWNGNTAKWDTDGSASQYKVLLRVGPSDINSIVIANDTIDATSIDYSSYLLPGNTYYFHVAPIVGSEQQSFVHGPAKTINGSIGTISPITIDSANKIATWPSVTGADGYDVWVLKNSAQIGIIKQTKDTSFNFSNDYLDTGNGDYSVRVGAYKISRGNYLATGESSKVTLNELPDTVTIKFDSNGGTGTMGDVTVAYASNYTLPDCSFTPPAGQEFDCWEINGGRIAAGVYNKFIADTTIKALWKAKTVTPITYTVTFVPGEGSGTSFTLVVNAGEKLSLPSCSFTAPENKVFDKWDIGKPNDKIDVSGDMTVTALWKAPDSYSVTVNVNNAEYGTASASPTSGPYGTVVTLTATPNPGYKFKEWQRNAGMFAGGSTVVPNATSATTTFTIGGYNVVVTAIFEADGTHTHSYGSDWKSDADKHWHECSCGDKSEEAAHTAGDWITDTAATATTDGTKHKECTVCGYVMENATIPATGGGEHTHSYGSEWKTDADKHWHECSCGDKSEEAAHTASEWIIDTEATATTDGTKHKECTVCGYVMETATIPATGIEHTHNYSSDWKSDADKHWHECSCGDKSEEAAHTVGDWIIDTAATATTDGTKHKECTVCGYVMETAMIPATGIEHTHNYSSDWKTDADEHWNECECGDKANKAAHADENNDGKCDICDYAMGNADNPGGEQPEKTGLSGGAIAGIAVGSVAVAGLGGFSLFWFVIKKKKFADLIALFKKK